MEILFINLDSETVHKVKVSEPRANSFAYAGKPGDLISYEVSTDKVTILFYLTSVSSAYINNERTLLCFVRNESKKEPKWNFNQH